MKTTTLPLPNLMNRSPVRAFLLIPFVLAYFGLSPAARAVCQEGCDLVNSSTFLGEGALDSNTTGVDNTAIGYLALTGNTTGVNNTAIGYLALTSNTGGDDNTAAGRSALSSNTTGIFNTATGQGALSSNTTGNFNTATGSGALVANTGGRNTADGFEALLSNTTGNNNTAIGYFALSRNTTGGNNIALGFQAGQNLTTGNGNIDIGNAGVAGESKTIRIGTTGTQTNTYGAGISGATVPTGVAVIVDISGHLGTTTSSARFKDAIKPMDKASEAILALKPVTFHYKKELDPDGIPQFGLVAEQVEKVNPALVARDDQGKVYTVRYEAVNAMLLNEFLKEHHQVQDLESKFAAQQKNFESQQKLFETTAAQQQKEIAALTAQIQKVTDQLALSKVAPQLVAESQ
jgi:hypothetical protein